MSSKRSSSSGWIKSSFSFSNGNCVEVQQVQLAWVKSTASQGASNCVELAWAASSASNGTHCVEAAYQPPCQNGECGPAHKTDTDGLVAVRDSKDPDGPVLYFTPAEWDAFLAGALNGEFTRDRLAALAEAR